MAPFSIIHYMAHRPRGAPPPWLVPGRSLMISLRSNWPCFCNGGNTCDQYSSCRLEPSSLRLLMTFFTIWWWKPRVTPVTWDPLCYVLFHRGAMWWRTRTWERSASQTRVTERRSCMRPVPYPRWRITQYWLAAWHRWSTFTVVVCTVGAMFDILINSEFQYISVLKGIKF